MIHHIASYQLALPQGSEDACVQKGLRSRDLLTELVATREWWHLTAGNLKVVYVTLGGHDVRVTVTNKAGRHFDLEFQFQ